MDTFSALLAICAGNSPVPSGLPAQRPVTRIFDIFFDLRLNIRLSKQSWGWWFETLSCPLWRNCNGYETSRGLFSFSVNFDKGASQETELVIIPSASMKLKGGVYWFHVVRLSVRLWTEICPPRIFNNTRWIKSIFIHLIKQLRKVCHA